MWNDSLILIHLLNWMVDERKWIGVIELEEWNSVLHDRMECWTIQLRRIHFIGLFHQLLVSSPFLFIGWNEIDTDSSKRTDSDLSSVFQKNGNELIATLEYSVIRVNLVICSRVQIVNVLMIPHLVFWAIIKQNKVHITILQFLSPLKEIDNNQINWRITMNSCIVSIQHFIQW